jgi:hypothetical protein
MNRRNESIAAPRRCFHKTRVLRIVPQGLAQPVGRPVEAAVEIDKCVRRPEPLLDLLPRDDFAGAFQQHGKNLKGLFLKFDLESLFPQFASLKIDLEDSKANSGAL